MSYTSIGVGLVAGLLLVGFIIWSYGGTSTLCQRDGVMMSGAACGK